MLACCTAIQSQSQGDPMATTARVKPSRDLSAEAASDSERPRARARDNERPLVEDIRLLGRILGDVIREQEGVSAYELVEEIRKLSVTFRRDADAEADKSLKKLLKSLSGDQTVSVIRAFTYSAIWPTWPRTATTSAAARFTSGPATRRKAASRSRCRACAGPASRPKPSPTPWPTPMSRRC